MSQTSSLQILLIEDNRGDARLFEELLREATTFVSGIPQNRTVFDSPSLQFDQPPELHHELTLSEGIERLGDDIDVVLLDLNLPDSRGIETLSKIADYTEKPVVVLTGLQEREIGLQAIRGGAEDYLVKDEINSDLLIRSVYHAIERRAHERELRQYETLIERSTDVNAIIDGDGTLRYVTPSIERVLGYSPEDVTDQNVLEFIHPDDQPEVSQALSGVIGEEEFPPIEFRVRDASGSWVILEARAQNLLEDPLVEGLVIYTRDVTERVAREEKLEQFARVVSHDLRNPLGIAQTYVQEIRRTGDLSELDPLERALDRIDSLTDSLLTLAREGQTIDDVERIDLAPIVRAAWSHVDSAHAELTMAPALGSIEADPERLQTLFENLFRNAIDHGGSTVEIRVDRTDGTFFVEDTGPGIEPDAREDVFEIGYSTGGGTGTGLAIVRAIARAHGWEVGIADRDGVGTRFEFHGLDRSDDAPAR